MICPVHKTRMLDSRLDPDGRGKAKMYFRCRECVAAARAKVHAVRKWKPRPGVFDGLR